jgi:hypothetical protein
VIQAGKSVFPANAPVWLNAMRIRIEVMYKGSSFFMLLPTVCGFLPLFEAFPGYHHIINPHGALAIDDKV